MFSVIVAVLFATSAAQDGAAQPSPQPSTVASEPKAEKPICRRQVATGSIQPKRICHTRAEWASIDTGNADNYIDARRRMQSNMPGRQN